MKDNNFEQVLAEYHKLHNFTQRLTQEYIVYADHKHFPMPKLDFDSGDVEC